MIHTFRLRAAIVLPAMIAVAMTASAQPYSVRAVLGNGATAGSAGNVGLVGTIGQGVIGITGFEAYAGYQGFWYTVPFSIPSGVDEPGIMPEAPIAAARNPFSDRTTLRINLTRAGGTSLKLYDVLGHEVATLLDGPCEAGVHWVPLDASALGSGNYVAQLVTPDAHATLRLMIVK